VRTPDRYLERIAAGASPEAGSEQLSPAAGREEAFALALRTREGAAPLPGTSAAVAELGAAGLVERRSDRIVLTRRGRLLANDVTARLLAAGTGGVPRASEPRDPHDRMAGTRYH
jgi:oxygen-independent coproporphyrinogen-3 oxidase